MTGDRPRAAWLFRLALLPASLARLAAFLDAEERVRAAGFRHAIDRDPFIARRGQLRLLLAEATGVSPATIRYATGPHGKPQLADGRGPFFSLSSAADTGLCVLDWVGEVGCDIALDAPVPDATAIARRLFSAAEQRALARLPPEEQGRGFLALWTRKEAYLKAIGTGLQRPLDDFTVGAGEGRSTIDGGEPGWSLAAIDAGAGHVAALAARGAAPLVARWFDPADASGGRAA